MFDTLAWGSCNCQVQAVTHPDLVMTLSWNSTDTCIDLGGGAWVKFMCSKTSKDATLTYGQFTDAQCMVPEWPAIDLGRADGTCREVPEFDEFDMAAPLISPFTVGMSMFYPIATMYVYISHQSWSCFDLFIIILARVANVHIILTANSVCSIGAMYW